VKPKTAAEEEEEEKEEKGEKTLFAIKRQAASKGKQTNSVSSYYGPICPLSNLLRFGPRTPENRPKVCAPSSKLDSEN